MKYDNMPIIKDSTGKFDYADNYHLIGDTGNCIQCGCQTKVIDVFSEAHICSTECQEQWDKYCNEQFSNMYCREKKIKANESLM